MKGKFLKRQDVIGLINKRAARFESMRADAVHEKDWSRVAALDARVTALKCLAEDVNDLKGCDEMN